MKHRRMCRRVLSCFGALLVLGATPSLAAEPTPPAATALAALVAEAREHNPELRAAAEERKAARERIPQAGALDDPMLEAGVVNLPAESLRFDREPMTMKMIGLSQKLPYPGKRGLREALAAKDAEAANYAYQETANRVVQRVKSAYYDLALSDESIRITRDNRAALGRLLELVRSRYEVGLASQADALKAQTQIAKMDDELLSLGRERRIAESELTRLLGRSRSEAIAPEPLRPQHAALPPLEILEADAGRVSPQLLALKSALARSGTGVELAHKDYYPDFDVRFSYGQRDNLPGMPQENLVSLTVAINLPLWRRSKLEPRVAEAEAMRDQAQSRYQAQLDELRARLRQAVASARQGLDSIRLYETAILPQARLTLDAALSAYQVGRADFLTLLDSQMAVFNYRVAHAAAVAGYDKARAEIDFLTGRPAGTAAEH
ncbi:MAG: TolC family protein [Betaproteobacteria bacterium]|nr:TolC family protein [Betaproteobacteria bacterium]